MFTANTSSWNADENVCGGQPDEYHYLRGTAQLWRDSADSLARSLFQLTKHPNNSVFTTLMELNIPDKRNGRKSRGEKPIESLLDKAKTIQKEQSLSVIQLITCQSPMFVLLLKISVLSLLIKTTGHCYNSLTASKWQMSIWSTVTKIICG